MAERRRRRRLSGSDDGSEDELLSSDNSQDREDRSDSESETAVTRKKGNDEDHSDKYESAEDHKSEDDDDYEDVTDEEEGEKSEGEESQIKEERTRGDGQEEKQLDTDLDRQNPQFIPRQGAYFEHDVRYTDEKDNRSTRPNTKKKLWKESEKWAHDMYNENDQAPKSRDEIVMVYGFDMRSDQNHRGAPRPYRGRGRGSGRGGRRPQYRDNKDYYSNRNDNYGREQQEYRHERQQRPQKQDDYHHEQRTERPNRNQRNSYRGDHSNDGFRGHRNDNRHWKQQSDVNEDYHKEQSSRLSQSPSDKDKARSFSYPRTREWTNTNYRKQREQLYHEQDERNDRNAHYSNRTNTPRGGREVKSYSKERRRPVAAARSQDEEVEAEITSPEKEITGLEESLEKITIKVETAHHGEGDTASVTRTITSETAQKPTSSNYPAVPQQDVKKVRHSPPKPSQRGGHSRQDVAPTAKSPPQRGGHSTSRPKRYSSQRQRQMPEAVPPSAMHLPPALMEGPSQGPQFFDPGFQGPMYHPNTTPPNTLEGTPPPPQGPPPPGDHMMRQGMLVQHDMNIHPGMQHPSQPHMPVPNPNLFTPVSMGTQPPPPPPPQSVGTYAPAFVTPGVVSYSVPPGPPYQMAPPVPVSAPIPTPAPAPPPPVPVPVQMQQFPVKQPPQGHMYGGQMYGGVTYYSTEQQQRVQRVPHRRPINRIPIQAPPDSQTGQKMGDKMNEEDMLEHQHMHLEGEMLHEHDDLLQHAEEIQRAETEEEGEEMYQKEAEGVREVNENFYKLTADEPDFDKDSEESEQLAEHVEKDWEEEDRKEDIDEEDQEKKEEEKPEVQSPDDAEIQSITEPEVQVGDVGEAEEVEQQQTEQPVEQEQREEQQPEKVEQPIQAHLQVEEIVQLEEQQPLQQKDDNSA